MIAVPDPCTEDEILAEPPGEVAAPLSASSHQAARQKRRCNNAPSSVALRSRGAFTRFPSLSGISAQVGRPVLVTDTALAQNSRSAKWTRLSKYCSRSSMKNEPVIPETSRGTEYFMPEMLAPPKPRLSRQPNV